MTFWPIDETLGSSSTRLFFACLAKMQKRPEETGRTTGANCRPTGNQSGREQRPRVSVSDQQRCRFTFYLEEIANSTFSQESRGTSRWLAPLTLLAIGGQNLNQPGGILVTCWFPGHLDLVAICIWDQLTTTTFALFLLLPLHILLILSSFFLRHCPSSTFVFSS